LQWYFYIPLLIEGEYQMEGPGEKEKKARKKKVAA
jgi:hypothetical protein